MNIFEYIVERSGTAYALTDARLKITAYNPAFLKFCMDKTCIMDAAIDEQVPELVGMKSALQKILSGRKPSIILPFINKDNVFYNCIIESFQDDNASGGLLITFTDISAQAGYRQTLAQRENQIRILKARLATRGKIAASELIGQSAAIQKIQQMVPRLARIQVSGILIEGETGTGKSMLANVLHNADPKPGRPFVSINCAAIPETLLESELFGSVKGAFTNALTDRTGLIESADGGTLFLDEISELPLKLQAKLLSFLETRKFRPLGSNKEKQVQIRLITATNKKLENCVADGTFREDLFYRLSIVPIHMPALRTMGKDVLLLAHYFIDQFNLAFHKQVQGLDASASKKLLAHHWPGNVRELSNCMEQAMIFNEKGLLSAEDIHLRSTPKTNLSFSVPDEGFSLEDAEKNYILSALEKAGGNKTKAARMLGLSRDTLRYRMEKFNL